MPEIRLTDGVVGLGLPLHLAEHALDRVADGRVPARMAVISRLRPLHQGGPNAEGEQISLVGDLDFDVAAEKGQVVPSLDGQRWPYRRVTLFEQRGGRRLPSPLPAEIHALRRQ